jgi:lipoprotein NlpI
MGERSGVPSRLSDVLAKTDMNAWPAPVIRMFMGQLTPAAVLIVADNPDAMKKKAQVCEAIFYSGQLALRLSAKDEAVRLFRIASSDCPRGFVEWSDAKAELKLLGEKP